MIVIQKSQKQGYIFFFSKYLWLKRLKKSHFMIETDKENYKKYIVASVLMKLYSIAFIAFAVLEKMLVQMYN
jgi:hypothetical protein